MRKYQITAEDTLLFVRSMGEGEPIVMIHGACTDSDYFLDTARILSHFFEVTLYDRRGYGRSHAADGADFSIPTQAEDAAAVIRTVGTSVFVIAHSAGTAIAMECAARHPEMIKSMILHEPVDADCREPGSEDTRQLQEIANLIRRGKYNRAIATFLPRIGEADPRARRATEEEMERMGPNCLHHVRREFLPTLDYASEASSLQSLQITIGVGEQSRNSTRFQTAIRLSQKLKVPLRYFPGSHNCAYDLPEEFACLCSGILLLDNTNRGEKDV